MRKGEQTRAAIVDAALDMASGAGLEGLTIGALAERMRMSKSGVFAHFGSREELQIAVLEEYERRFAQAVLMPGLKERRGLPRLRAIVRNWLERTAREADSDCIYISGAIEYDDRPGAVREELVAMIRGWQRELTRAIAQTVEAGELAADLDLDEFLFQLYGIVLVLHHESRLMRSPDSLGRAQRVFERLVASYGGRARAAASRGSAPASKNRTNVRSRSDPASPANS